MNVNHLKEAAEKLSAGLEGVHWHTMEINATIGILVTLNHRDGCGTRLVSTVACLWEELDGSVDNLLLAKIERAHQSFREVIAKVHPEQVPS